MGQATAPGNASTVPWIHYYSTSRNLNFHSTSPVKTGHSTMSGQQCVHDTVDPLFYTLQIQTNIHIPIILGPTTRLGRKTITCVASVMARQQTRTYRLRDRRYSSHPLKSSKGANPRGPQRATQPRQGRTTHSLNRHDGNKSALVAQPKLPQDAI